MYDFICIGAGPSNLSIAIQAYEIKDQIPLSFLVLEKEKRVRWHPGMLLPGSRMDTHFVKDLITLINPTSKFTFINFLKQHERLEDFLNCGNVCPYRRDFDEYLSWVADNLSSFISIGCEVIKVEKQENGTFSITSKSKDGKVEKFNTRNVVFGAGSKPNYICNLQEKDNGVIHTSRFLDNIENIPVNDANYKVIIVGSGQSSAEVTQYLLENTKCELHVVLSDYSYLSKEGTAFINESYNGRFVDSFYEFKQEDKIWFNKKRSNMNYGVVDSDLINSLYNNNYYYKNFEARCIKFRSFTHVEEVINIDKNLLVTLNDRIKKVKSEEEFNHIILATGYIPNFSVEDLSSIINSDIEYLKVNRNFSIGTVNSCKQENIYLNGNVSESHGPAEDVLSVISHRSRDILNSIIATSQ